MSKLSFPTWNYSEFIAQIFGTPKSHMVIFAGVLINSKSPLTIEFGGVFFLRHYIYHTKLKASFVVEYIVFYKVRQFSRNNVVNCIVIKNE